MARLKVEIDDRIINDGHNEHCIVSVQDVFSTVSRLKAGKHDGHLGLSSDHVKHACDEWYIHVSMLFTALTVHGSTTEDSASSTVLPIPKGKNLNYSDSTRLQGYGSKFHSWKNI